MNVIIAYAINHAHVFLIFKKIIAERQINEYTLLKSDLIYWNCTDSLFYHSVDDLPAGQTCTGEAKVTEYHCSWCHVWPHSAHAASIMLHWLMKLSLSSEMYNKFSIVS